MSIVTKKMGIWISLAKKSGPEGLRTLSAGSERPSRFFQQMDKKEREDSSSGVFFTTPFDCP